MSTDLQTVTTTGRTHTPNKTTPTAVRAAGIIKEVVMAKVCIYPTQPPRCVDGMESSHGMEVDPFGLSIVPRLS